MPLTKEGGTMGSYYDTLLKMGVAQTPLPSSGACGFGYYVGTTWCPVKPTLPPNTACTKSIGGCTDDEIDALLTNFITAYPEISISLHEESPHNSAPGIAYYRAITRRLHCLYPGYTCVSDACTTERFYLLLAHYLVTSQGNGADFNPNTVASVHTGDASISFNTAYTDSVARNPFFLWLTKSPYGNTLLMYIKSQQGYPIVV